MTTAKKKTRPGQRRERPKALDYRFRREYRGGDRLRRQARPQDEFPIEDPAQAWNALTIGGYTDLIDVRDEGYENWTPMVAAGELSPHSRTSVTWPQGLSPFKPELVMEAGNRAVNPGQTEMLTVGSLSLLTTGSETGLRLCRLKPPAPPPHRPPAWPRGLRRSIPIFGRKPSAP